MKNLMHHTDLLCELVFVTRGIKMGGISKLRWLIGFIKYTIWANSCLSYACFYFQLPKSWLHPTWPYDHPRKHVGLTFTFLEDPLSHGTSATLTGNIIDTEPSVAVLLQKSVFSFAVHPNVISSPYTFDLLGSSSKLNTLLGSQSWRPSRKETSNRGHSASVSEAT
jgi:hypothetical protein